MLDIADIKVLKKMYENGENIIQYVKSNTHFPAEEAIMLSYDLQAGSYIKALSNQKLKELKQLAGKKLSGIFRDLNSSIVCEVGVGEGTTLANVLEYSSVKEAYGFDISLSRLLYAQRFLKEADKKINLFCAELDKIPLPDNSIDCVYSYHSLEPNGGKEKQLLTELMRITKNHLILIEPDYDMFDDLQRVRMASHGYIRHLPGYFKDNALDADIIHYEPWQLDSNQQNKASIILVKKKSTSKIENQIQQFVSPVSHAALTRVSEGWYSQEDGYIYPIIHDISIFLRKNAILASHYHYFYADRT